MLQQYTDISMLREMTRTWNFYRFSLKDVQRPAVFAARQSSYAPFSTQGDLRLKQLPHFSEEFHRLFVPFFSSSFVLFPPGNLSTL